jgi:hypothetical protein
MEEYFAMCPMIKIKMDGKLKWMKGLNGWKKRWTKGWTKHVHNQKLCVNLNTNSSQPRGMCQPKHHMFISKKYVPIRNWYNIRPHIFYTISNWFLFEFSLSNLLCLRAFLLLER